jgi:Trpc4-associated protein
VLILFSFFVQTAKFLSVVESNFIDSNFLLRSLVLSYHFFQADPDLARVYPWSADKMNEFTMSSYTRILAELMTCITVQDLDPDNICCLNTAIVMLVFARRKSQLAATLQVRQGLLFFFFFIIVRRRIKLTP